MVSDKCRRIRLGTCLVLVMSTATVLSSLYNDDLMFQRHESKNLSNSTTIPGKDVDTAHSAITRLHPENLTSWLTQEFKPPNTPGAFLHLGKTGGSTVSMLLRNGCHSWVQKPCHSPVNESYVSQLTTYYHVPDFPNLKKHRYTFYVLSTRDPLERTISAFTYMHPTNQRARQQQPDRRTVQFYEDCFSNLDEFAQTLEKNTTCGQKASAALDNENKGAVHLYYDTKHLERLLPNSTTTLLLVVRNRHLWEDWKSANAFLGEENSQTFPAMQLRQQTNQPITKSITQGNKMKLCAHLRTEYESYLRLLSAAANLTPQQKAESLVLAQTNCPELHLSMPT